MAIPEEHTFAREDVFPSWFANAIQKFLATGAPSFQLARLDATHIQVAAGSGIDAAIISVAGAWRWNEATISRAHPGGAAGTWDIFAVAVKDKIDSSPSPGTDNTDRSFGLRILKAGETPTVEAGIVDIFRKVGSLTWTGAAISSVTQTLGHRAEVVFPVGPWLSVSATKAPVGGELVEMHPSEGPIVLPPPASSTNKVIGAVNTHSEGELEISCPTGEIWTIGKTLKLNSGECVILISDGTNWLVQSIRRRTGAQGAEAAFSFNEDHIPSATRHVRVNLRVRSKHQPGTIAFQVLVGGVKIHETAIPVGTELEADWTVSFVCAPGEAWRVNGGGGFYTPVATYRVLGHE